MTHARSRARTTARPALATVACLTATLAATLVVAGCGDDTDRTVNSSAVAADSRSAEPTPASPTSAGSGSAGSGTGGPRTAAPTSTSPTSTAESTEPTESTETNESTEPEAPDSGTAKPELIPYAGGESPGVEVRSAADTKKLAGAPEAFKAFIGRTAEQVVAKSHCHDGFVGVTVEAVRTDGYAIGGVNDCGGYLALWAVEDGAWTEVAGTQEMWDCAVLSEHKAPSELVGEVCYDNDAQQERAYHQA